MLHEISVNVNATDYEDRLAEYVAELDDPEEYLEPYDWPDWTDRWVFAPDVVPASADWDNYNQYLAEQEPEPFDPTVEDIAALDAICEEIERRLAFMEAMALADVQEAIDDERYRDALPRGFWD